MTTSTNIATAATYLNARIDGDTVIWRDDALRHDVCATVAEVERLASALDAADEAGSSRNAAYSMWCTETGIEDVA